MEDEVKKETPIIIDNFAAKEGSLTSNGAVERLTEKISSELNPSNKPFDESISIPENKRMRPKEIITTAKYKKVFLVSLAQILLFGSMALLIYWVYGYQGGIQWSDDTKKQYNLHYILMTAGFIFFNGQSYLVYRTWLCFEVFYVKLIHAAFFMITIACITLGFLSAIQAQNNLTQPKHLYSIHSWLGLTTIVIFGLQFVFGFVAFLILKRWEKATANFRKTLLPIHVTFGLVIYSMSVAACLTGLTQTATSRLSGEDDKENYKDLQEQGFVVNAFGILIISLGIVIPNIIRTPSFKR